MTWSFRGIGKPENIIRAALEAHSETLTGDSKAEFDEVKPHLLALVGMNQGNAYLPLIVVASGHAARNMVDDKLSYSTCRVSIGFADVPLI